MEPETDVVFGLKTEPKTEKSITVDAPIEIEPLDIDRHGHEHSMEEHDSPVFKTPVFESLEEFKYQTADDLWSEMHSAMGVPGQFVPKRQIPRMPHHKKPRIPHHQPIKSHHHPMHHPMLTEMGNKIVKGLYGERPARLPRMPEHQAAQPHGLGPQPMLDHMGEMGQKLVSFFSPSENTMPGETRPTRSHPKDVYPKNTLETFPVLSWAKTIAQKML